MEADISEYSAPLATDRSLMKLGNAAAFCIPDGLPRILMTRTGLAKVIANHGDSPWGTLNGIAVTAKWIWENTNSNTAYCRLTLH